MSRRATRVRNGLMYHKIDPPPTGEEFGRDAAIWELAIFSNDDDGVRRAYCMETEEYWEVGPVADRFKKARAPHEAPSSRVEFASDDPDDGLSRLEILARDTIASSVRGLIENCDSRDLNAITAMGHLIADAFEKAGNNILTVPGGYQLQIKVEINARAPSNPDQIKLHIVTPGTLAIDDDLPPAA